MSNKKNIIIFGVIGLMVATLVYMISSGTKRYSWQEHYKTNHESPYGTSVVFELMDSYLSEEKIIIEDSLENILLDTETAGTYFFLGPNLWLDSARTNALLHFVERGNDAFIISSYLDFELLDTVGNKNCIDLTYERDSFYYSEYDCLITDSIVSLNLTHPELKKENGYEYNFRYRSEDEYYDWTMLPPDIFCQEQGHFFSLGTLNDSLHNFAGVKYGDGHFYFHTTPLAFTNYHIAKEGGRKYAEKVFSHMSKAPVLWDKTEWSFEFPGSKKGFGKSPLKYVLSQPSLAWAWYILLGMAALYLIFRAKRRQRIIPVLEKNENTSLEFIKTIGRLYFIQNNHRQLALQKTKLFLGFIRDRYNIPTRELNDHFKIQLATKSEIPLPVIEKIFTLHENIERSRFTSENTLVAFHQEMEKFYLGCK